MLDLKDELMSIILTYPNRATEDTLNMFNV